MGKFRILIDEFVAPLGSWQVQNVSHDRDRPQPFRKRVAWEAWVALSSGMRNAGGSTRMDVIQAMGATPLHAETDDGIYLVDLSSSRT